MKKKLIVLSGFVMGLAPVMAFAQGAKCVAELAAAGSGRATLGSILCKINELLAVVVPLLIALGVVYFIWGVASYVIAADEEAKSKGRDKMIYGIIGLAVIIAVWGLVGVLTRTFGVDGNQVVNPPTVPSY